MRYLTLPLALLLLVLAGCGSGSPTTASAKQAAQTYWTDFLHFKARQAYQILTPGVHQTISFSTFSQDMVGLLKSTGGFSIAIQKSQVVGNCAQVKIRLVSVKGGPLVGYQNLVRTNGAWKISDENGQINTTYIPLKTCAY